MLIVGLTKRNDPERSEGWSSPRSVQLETGDMFQVPPIARTGMAELICFLSPLLPHVHSTRRPLSRSPSSSSYCSPTHQRVHLRTPLRVVSAASSNPAPGHGHGLRDEMSMRKRKSCCRYWPQRVEDDIGDREPEGRIER